MKRYLILMLLVFGRLIGDAPALAQSSQADTLTHGVIRLGPGEMVPNGPVKLRFAVPRMLPEKAKDAAIGSMTGASATKLVTVPLWLGSVPASGPVQQPFAMVGRAPVKGGTTRIPTQLLPIALTFEGTTDPATGKPITLGLDSQTLSLVIGGPDFAKAAYGTGATQFADAVQRAQWRTVERANWHTLLKKPKVLDAVTIDVPDNIGGAPVYQMFQTSDGTYFAFLDNNFLVSQLETVMGVEKTNPRGLLIPMVKNIGLIENGDPRICCIASRYT